MRRIAATMLVALLLTSLWGTTALAYNSYAGDVVKSRARAYSTRSLSRYLFTIPANTAVAADMFPEWCKTGTNYADYRVARIRYHGTVCYIKTSKLLKYDYKTHGVYYLKKGTRVYERPSKASLSVSIKKKTKIYLCGAKGNWALVRTYAGGLDSQGYYGYVYKKRN